MKKIYLFTSIMMLLIGFTSNAQVVISQVYGGGGNAGATYTHDFIELFNRGTVPQDLTGWSVQYASATGSTWSKTDLPSAILQPGRYFLIQQATTAAVGIALPTPDWSGINASATPPSTGIAMSGSTGKVVLASSTTLVTGTNPVDSQVVDKVGFGTTPNGFEGTGPTGTVISATTSAQRLNNGCTDGNNNSSDFIVALPIPRNSATATSICSTSPSVTITSPTNATIYNPLTTSVTVNVSVSNFTVANGTGTGHIHYTVDGGTAVMKYDTTPIVLTGLSVGSHTVEVSLVDNAHAPLAPAVSTTCQFTIAAFTNVATISELRAGALSGYYTLTGTAVVSHVRTPAGTVTVSTTRNQKFIQDATAGVLIDDSAAKIITPFAVGDSMSNVSGQLTNFNGILQLVPLQNQTVVSSGNTLTPQNISIAALNADVNTYESKLISFNNITITGTVLAGVVTPLAAGAVFITNTNYNVFDGTTNGVLRTGFAEADYIGAVIPTVAFNAVALGYDNVTTAVPPVLTPQFIIRNAADFSVTLATAQNDIAGLKIYPNPISNGVLHIESNLNTERTVTLFDVLGKQVLTTTTSNNTINVAALNSGIYIVKITEGGKTATRKLVIK
jgi:hypothetical protein